MEIWDRCDIQGKLGQNSVSGVQSGRRTEEQIIDDARKVFGLDRNVFARKEATSSDVSKHRLRTRETLTIQWFDVRMNEDVRKPGLLARFQVVVTSIIHYLSYECHRMKCSPEELFGEIGPFLQHQYESHGARGVGCTPRLYIASANATDLRVGNIQSRSARSPYFFSVLGRS